MLAKNLSPCLLKQTKKKKQFLVATLTLLTVKTSRTVLFKILVLLHHWKIESKSIYIGKENVYNLKLYSHASIMYFCFYKKV